MGDENNLIFGSNICVTVQAKEVRSDYVPKYIISNKIDKLRSLLKYLDGERNKGICDVGIEVHYKYRVYKPIRCHKLVLYSLDFFKHKLDDIEHAKKNNIFMNDNFYKDKDTGIDIIKINIEYTGEGNVNEEDNEDEEEEEEKEDKKKYYNVECNCDPNCLIDLQNMGNVISYNHMNLIVDYLYKGKVDLFSDKIQIIQLYKNANYLMMDFLVEDCVNFIKYNLNIGNALYYYKALSIYNDLIFSEKNKDLIYYCKQFIYANIDEISNTKLWEELNVKEIMSFYGKYRTSMISDYILARCLVKWLEKQHIHPKKMTEKMINNVAKYGMEWNCIQPNLLYGEKENG